MAANLEEAYNPAEDDNQGVAQLLAQGDQANEGAGVAQNPQFGMESTMDDESTASPITGESDTEANGVNDELLAEEDVEAKNVITD